MDTITAALNRGMFRVQIRWPGEPWKTSGSSLMYEAAERSYYGLAANGLPRRLLDPKGRVVLTND